MTHALYRGEPLRMEQVRAALDRLAEQPVEDLPVAAWHPTGFVVVPLHRDDHGALRLHLWPADTREHGSPCWPIHDHVWHLRSHVLCGAVESHGYEVDDDPEGEAVLYAVEYGPGHRSCLRRSERRVRVRAMAPRRVSAGQSYAVEAGMFHASRVPIPSMAATLVVTRRTDQPWPWVVGEPGAPERIPVERPLADGAMVRTLVRRVSAAFLE